MSDLCDAATRSDGVAVRGTRSVTRTASARWVSTAVFVAAMVVAVPLYLVRARQWFFLDDWDFLANRRLTSVRDLFLPHNEHWMTVPVIVYRVLWSVVGLRYAPYELVVIALHLVVAVLLRKIMLRSGVDPWIATAAAVLFVFLGAGRESIVLASDMGFVAALACGLGHLILADHAGLSDRRDAIGLALGLLGLLCSGVAVAMVMVVGLAVFIRRGLRPAALHTLPLAVVCGVWYVVIGHEGYTSYHVTIRHLQVFVQTALSFALSRTGQVWGVGAVLGIVTIVGLVFAWTSLSRFEFRARAAAPVALLGGAFAFSLITGYGRVALGATGGAKEGRYVHLLAALMLPAIAFAMDTLMRRWRGLYLVFLVLLLIGIPGNVIALSPHGADRYTRGNEQQVLTVAHSPYLRRVPASYVVPVPGLLDVTAGWLAGGAASGNIPKPSNVTPNTEAAATLTLVLVRRAVSAATQTCQQITSRITVRAQSGDVYMFSNHSVAVHVPLRNGTLSPGRVFPRDSAVTVQGGPVTLAFTGVFGAEATLCRPQSTLHQPTRTVRRVSDAMKEWAWAPGGRQQ